MRKVKKNIISIGIIASIFFLLISCKTKIQYVPVEKTNIEYRDRLKLDSIYQYDSIYVREKGDTIFKYQYKYLYRDKLIVDTMFISSIEQVPFPVEVIKEVNRIRGWQIILMCLGGVFIGYIGYKIIRFIRK